MAANMTPQGYLPMPVQQAAMSHQLGPFTRSYKTTFVKSIIGIIVFTLAGFFFAWVGVQADDGAVVSFVFVLLFFALVAYLIYQIVQVAGQQVYLFQHGLIIEKNGQVQVFPWNQTAEVYQSITRHYRNGIYTGTTYNYRLRRTDGYQVKLDNMTKGIAELGQAVSRAVTVELVPRALHSIHAGQTLTFAQFSVNQQGIGNGRDFLPWAQVEAVNVNRGVVTVKKAGKFLNWGSAAVSKIPNFLVFTLVAEEMIRQNGGARPV